MDYDPPVFHEAVIGSAQPSACSPRVEDRRYRGLLIALPARMRAPAGEKLKIPVCGFYRLPTFPLLQGATMNLHVRSLNLPHPVQQSVLIIEGVDEQIARPPQEPLDPAIYAHQVSTSYFTVDAQRYLPRALQPGRYEAYISYGQTQSNVVRFEVVGG